MPQGYYIDPDRNIFKGNFINGKRHGFGLCVLYSGQIYKGEWENDSSKGYGFLKTIFGVILESEFSNGFKSDASDTTIHVF